MRELDRLDRLHGLGALPTAERVRRPRREGVSTVATLLVTALVVGGIVAFAPGEQMRVVRQALGIAGGRPLPIPALTDGGGSYAFMMTQPGSRTPVGYDPCRTIEVEVNPAGAPDNHESLVDDAIEHIEEAAGLDLEVVGSTTDRPADREGLMSQPPPVLVAWATADEVPGLAGDIAGLGGSSARRQLDGRLEFVTGAVILDQETFEGFTAFDGSAAQAIVDHEFGHLVGLDHVDDPDELMYEENNGAPGFGPGDLEGLARLGRIPC